MTQATTSPPGLLRDSAGRTIKWGDQMNPFMNCPSYGACADLPAAAAEPPPPANGASSQTQASRKEFEKALKDFTPSAREKFLKMFDESFSRKDGSLDLAGAKNMQTLLNDMIDQVADKNTSTKAPQASAKEKFEDMANLSELITLYDKVGIQSQDLSLSRFGSHRVQFAQDVLQSALDYRTDLVTRMKAETNKNGPEFEKYKKDLKDLTERMSQMYPDRRQEFQAYQDQVLKSLAEPGLAAPAPR